MLLILGVAVALALLTVVAMELYSRFATARWQQMEKHLDDHGETITEHRIRRNFLQGG
jgi:hypothetical protein